MTFFRLSSIFYSAIALLFMLALIIASYFSFDAGFVRRAVENQDYPAWIPALCALVAILLIMACIFALYRGVSMWRARSWLKDGRVMTGAELKFEAAVIIGLGITVLYLFLRGSI